MTSAKISRRNFIRIFSLLGIGAGIAFLERITQPLGAARFVRLQARSKYQQYLGKSALVGLITCPSYQTDIQRLLGEYWEKTRMPGVAGKRILVKPNLVDAVAEFPSITSPEVVVAAVDLLKDLGASQVVVGDGPAFRREADGIVHAIGLHEALEKRGVLFVDLNYDDPQPVPARRDWFIGVNEIWLPRHVIEADLILSIPKMKTHHWAGVSLSLKNLLGLMPGARYGWPKNFIHFHGIALTTLGLYEMLPEVVSIVDGIVGMEGDGPLFGAPVAHGILVIGSDPVAVDVTCAKLMGFNPYEIEHLGLAAWGGVGQAHRIQTVGLPLSQVQRNYRRPPLIS